MADCKKCDNSLDAIQLDETPKLVVKGRKININALDDIMKEVRSRNLQEPALGTALLEEVKRLDYVPPSMAGEYRAALLQDYQRRYG
ncbi:MAG TPA: hypothetical protein PKJ15_03945 [Methanomassiliicoccales archaeon]|nr:hypothetical protein [Methanomassiliicoccales archaeon]